MSGQRVRFIGGVPFTVGEDDVPMSGGPVDFDGGCRQVPPRRAPIEWRRSQEDPAWFETTIEDGGSPESAGEPASGRSG